MALARSRDNASLPNWKGRSADESPPPPQRWIASHSSNEGKIGIRPKSGGERRQLVRDSHHRPRVSPAYRSPGCIDAQNRVQPGVPMKAANSVAQGAA